MLHLILTNQFIIYHLLQINLGIIYSRVKLQRKQELLPYYTNAFKILSKFIHTKKSIVYTLFDCAMKKEGYFIEVVKYFRSGADRGSSKAMCEYQKLLLNCLFNVCIILNVEVE